MRKIIYFLFVIILITESCKKDDQTTKTLKNIYGYRTLKKYTVNGVDSLNIFNDSLGLQFNFYYSELDTRNVLLLDNYSTTIIKWNLICSWRLYSDKYIYIYSAVGPIGTGPLGNGKTPFFEILSSGKELILKTTYNSNEYYLEL